MLQKIRWFCLLIGVLAVVVVAFQNDQLVELDILFFHRTYSLTLLLLASSAVSFVLGSLMTAWRMRSRAQRKKAAVSAAEKAISEAKVSEGAEMKVEG